VDDNVTKSPADPDFIRGRCEGVVGLWIVRNEDDVGVLDI
jgi:hypothetical protein